MNLPGNQQQTYGGAATDGTGYPEWLSNIFTGIGGWWNQVSGTASNNQFNAQEAQKARLFNSAEAQKQRDFEEYMSNTAYQRQVSDMQAAGLNPAMMFGGASGGSSTPSGSSASSEAAQASAAKSSGGFLGLIGKIASIAIAKGLEAKFTNSALKAADNHELVTAKVRNLAAEEKAMTARASADYVKGLHELSKTPSGAIDAYESYGDYFRDYWSK